MYTNFTLRQSKRHYNFKFLVFIDKLLNLIIHLAINKKNINRGGRGGKRKSEH